MTSLTSRSVHPVRVWLPGGAWALALFALGLVRTFVPRAVGLADNGGNAALACRLGITPEDEVRYFAFAVFRWVTDGDPSCAAGTSGAPWPQLAGLWIARTVSVLLGAGALDLRVVSVAWCALAAVTAALVGQVARRRRHGRAVTTALTWVLLMDSSFAGYPASLYPQAAGLAGLVVCTAGWLLLDSSVRARRTTGWVAVGLGCAVLVSSGPVAALAVVPLGAALVLRARRVRRPGRTRRGRRAGAGWVTPVTLTVVLTVLAAGAVAGVGPEQRRYDTWDYVSTGVLSGAPRPGPELAAMGLPADAEQFVGVPVWSPGSIRGWSRWPDVDPDPLRVWGYVVTHPGVLYERLDDTVRALGDGRPHGAGSFAADDGAHPGEQEHRVTLFSARQAQLSGLGLPVAVAATGVLAWLALVIARSPVHGHHARRLASTALVLLGIAVSQVVGTAFTEAGDVGRYVVVGSLAGLLSLCLLVAAGLTSRALDAAARPQVAREHEPGTGSRP